MCASVGAVPVFLPLIRDEDIGGREVSHATALVRMMCPDTGEGISRNPRLCSRLYVTRCWLYRWVAVLRGLARVAPTRASLEKSAAWLADGPVFLSV